jgi:hypothetical protein
MHSSAVDPRVARRTEGALAAGCTYIHTYIPCIHPRCRSSCTVRPRRARSATRRWRISAAAAVSARLRGLPPPPARPSRAALQQSLPTRASARRLALSPSGVELRCASGQQQPGRPRSCFARAHPFSRWSAALRDRRPGRVPCACARAARSRRAREAIGGGPSAIDSHAPSCSLRWLPHRSWRGDAPHPLEGNLGSIMILANLRTVKLVERTDPQKDGGKPVP